MAPRAPRSRAAQAAAQLLTERVRHVEDLDKAIAAHSDAEAAVQEARRAADAAAVAARESYGRAREAGWTDSELEQLGYAGARPPRTGTRRPRRAPDGKRDRQDAAELTSGVDRNHPAGVGQ